MTHSTRGQRPCLVPPGSLVLGRLVGSFFILLLAVGIAFGQTNAPTAARSVHLWYPAPEGTVFYNEVTVEESVNDSYFMACGFAHGYFGIQQLGSPTNTVALFSVWDPGDQNNPDHVSAEKRVECLASGEGVRIRRFGGEGTGGQSMTPFPWKIGETIRFVVAAKTNENRTTFSAWIYRNDRKTWQIMASFRTLTGGKPLGGYYSFIEDFRRDGQSPRQRRRARFGHGWVKARDGRWSELTQARFTADRTPLDNIDAGISDRGFFLATGGDTTNHTTLRSSITRPAGGQPPGDLPVEASASIRSSTDTGSAAAPIPDRPLRGSDRRGAKLTPATPPNEAIHGESALPEDVLPPAETSARANRFAPPHRVCWVEGRPASQASASRSHTPSKARVERPRADEPPDDEAIFDYLETEGGKLLAHGRVCTNLQSQLHRRQCALRLPATQARRLTTPDLESAVEPGVVVVGAFYHCKKCGRAHVSPASGFAVSDSGAIATSRHVVDADDVLGIVVMTRDGGLFPVASVLAADALNDVVLLQAEGGRFRALPLSATARVGSPVVVLSHPADHFYTLTTGIVARRSREHTPDGEVSFIDITADFASGSSGAPVLDEEGNVIALVNSTESIYYDERKGRQTDLQMVVHNCTPARALLELVRER